MSAVSARRVGALVGADATLERVSLESGFAHALRWVGWTAFRVDSASESLARTSAEISGVNEEWRRADALAGLNTFFVRVALAISGAATLSGRTQTIESVAIVTGRTFTLMATDSVSTNGVVATSLWVF